MPKKEVINDDRLMINNNSIFTISNSNKKKKDKIAAILEKYKPQLHEKVTLNAFSAGSIDLLNYLESIKNDNELKQKVSKVKMEAPLIERRAKFVKPWWAKFGLWLTRPNSTLEIFKTQLQRLNRLRIPTTIHLHGKDEMIENSKVQEAIDSIASKDEHANVKVNFKKYSNGDTITTPLQYVKIMYSKNFNHQGFER